MCDDRLEGGHDQGASLVAGTVRRSMGPWTLAVQALLAHLADRGFSGAPRPLGSDEQGREVVSYLPGTTVGSRLPWPSWVRSGHTLHQVARWLRDYHHAISDFTPPPGAVWREGGTWRPGQVVAHNDAAPYNAVWGRDGLVGFVDWDMAGPQTVEADLAWVAFAWVPLHARAVVAREGFSAFAERRARLETFLRAYGWSGSTGDLLETLAAVGPAPGGDAGYRASRGCDVPADADAGPGPRPGDRTSRAGRSLACSAAECDLISSP